MTDRHITPYFALHEFACHSGEDVPDWAVPNIEALVLGVLQPVRERHGALSIKSGWRSRAYNAMVGGAPGSAHPEGKAADITPARPLIANIRDLHDGILALYEAGKLPALGGLGYYPGRWVHVDIRREPDGHLRRWTGRGIGSEPG